MFIYSIRDRLLNYFMQPFFGPTDNQVLAALAESINNEDNKHAFAKTPQHFEIWRLGEVTEEGKVTENREYVADASSLVRPSVRANGSPGAHQDPAAALRGLRAAEFAQRYAGAPGGPTADQAPPEGLQAGQVREGSEGLSRQPNG